MRGSSPVVPTKIDKEGTVGGETWTGEIHELTWQNLYRKVQMQKVHTKDSSFIGPHSLMVCEDDTVNPISLSILLGCGVIGNTSGFGPGIGESYSSEATNIKNKYYEILDSKK